MIKKLLFIFIISAGFVGVFLLSGVNSLLPESSSKSPRLKVDSKYQFWKYSCIDTMKSSRDNARNWKDWVGLKDEVDKQTLEIADLGANCIAIDTPYDKEFLPYLQTWVKSARKHNLKIWYRGNFSGWEGWFNYPKNLTSQELFPKITEFITQNPSLFENGDIFTGAPEAENGGEFNQVEVPEYPNYRQFLIKEVMVENQAFGQINKQVVTNWLSMNGGFAKRMLDQVTLSQIGDLVTIDHYIKTPGEMGDYINYFKNQFNAKVVIGEFGAPIPEINGNMSENQQAEFINKLMQQLYLNRDNVEGLNYWDLSDGSTALINPNHTQRKAVAVLENYFKPAIITGIVSDNFNHPLKNVRIRSSDGGWDLLTDQNGEYFMAIPGNEVTVLVSGDGFAPLSEHLSLNSQTEKHDFKLQPKNEDLIYKLKLFVKKLRH